MLSRRFGVLLITALLLNACAQSAAGVRPCPGKQIIITFVPNVDVMYPGFETGLSNDAGMPIEFMRRLFDNHYLYCAHQGAQTSSLDDALQRLLERPDIQTVEIDDLKRPGAAQ